MIKSAYRGLSILEISKIAIYEFWFDYVKTKMQRRRKIISHEYSQLYRLYKSRRHIPRQDKIYDNLNY